MAAVPLAAADANVAAQPPVPAAVPAAAPLVVLFALTPGLATQGIMDFSSSDGKKFYYQATKSINETATKKLIISAKKNGIKQFIFLSSCSVYGFSKNNCKEKTFKKGEALILGKFIPHGTAPKSKGPPRWAAIVRIST